MMSHEPDFDASHETFMTSLSEAMADLIPLVFPARMEVCGLTHELHSTAISQMESSEIELFLGVVDKGLGPFYERHKGLRWKEEKLEEMCEPGLIYVWYAHEGALSCFMCVMMALEPLGKTLYLYEIHVLPEFQGHHLGSRLMDYFHEYGLVLNTRAKLETQSETNTSNSMKHFSCAATGLTVFADNERAFNWYRSLGYTFTPDSPLDKHLRNGKVVKPSYYLLSRHLRSSKH